MTLTDEQCMRFRQMPGSFNEMVRAIFSAGQLSEREAIAQYIVDQGTIESKCQSDGELIYYVNNVDVSLIRSGEYEKI